MATHGGKRPGAGRKKGVVSQAKREMAEMAKEHADAAFQTLVRVSSDLGAPAAAQVSAATAILDRAYGKPKQALIGGDEDDPPLKTITRIERRIVRPADTDGGGL